MQKDKKNDARPKEIFGVEFDKESLEKTLENNLKIKELSKDTGLEELKQEVQQKQKIIEIETAKFLEREKVRKNNWSKSKSKGLER
ncbi:MAG: hypothetical protein ACRC4S_00115 [Cetobacterium sp.]